MAAAGRQRGRHIGRAAAGEAQRQSCIGGGAAAEQELEEKLTRAWECGSEGAREQ